MQEVEHIFAIYQTTYASRVGPLSVLIQDEGQRQEEREGDIRLGSFFDVVGDAGGHWSTASENGPQPPHTGMIAGIEHFDCVIKATDDYNPDPREDDSYGTYLSLSFRGKGPYANLLIESKNEHALFLRLMEQSMGSIDNNQDVHERLTLLRRRARTPLSSDEKEREGAFIAAFLEALESGGLTAQ